MVVTRGKNQKVNRAIAERNKTDLSKILSPLGVSPKGINLLHDRYFTKQRINRRINIMKAEGIPLKGLVWRLQLSEKKFEEFVNRHKAKQAKDKEAVRELNRVLPKWAESRVLKKFTPTNILQKVQACLANGIKPTPYVLANYSAKSISNGQAKAPHSLNIKEVQRISGPQLFSAKESEKDVTARLAVIRVVTSKPHLTVNRRWLARHLTQEGIANYLILRAVDALTTVGVLSSKKGFLRITKYYRTGDKSWWAQKARF